MNRINNNLGVGNRQRRAIKLLQSLMLDNPAQVWYRPWEFAEDRLQTCKSLVQLGFLEEDVTEGYRYKPTPMAKEEIF
jgi:hypothetical protein